MTMIHPASIQARVGAVLSKIEMNIEQQDTAGMVNFVKLLVAYCRPYLDEDRDLASDLDAIKPFSYDKSEDQAFDDEMRRIQIILRLLKKHNIFGYRDVALGDSSALNDPTEELTIAR